MDPNSPTSVNSALRFWGCAIQAGAQVSGAFGVASPNSSGESIGTVKKNFLPLPCSLIPHLSVIPSPDWNEIMLNETSARAKELLSLNTRHTIAVVPSVRFDPANKSVTLFMPGFDKSEIKLYQRRVEPLIVYVIKEPNEDNLVSLIDHGQEWQNDVMCKPQEVPPPYLHTKDEFPCLYEFRIVVHPIYDHSTEIKLQQLLIFNLAH